MMKKGKVITKNHIAVFVMVLALAAAVWLNMRYSGESKFLGEAAFVSNKGSSKTAETAASVKEKAQDYFEKAVKDREEAFDKTQETVEESLKSANLSEDEKQKVLDFAKEWYAENFPNYEDLAFEFAKDSDSGYANYPQYKPGELIILKVTSEKSFAGSRRTCFIAISAFGYEVFNEGW